MMIEWSSKAVKDVERLPGTERLRIVEAVERLAFEGLGDIRKLHGTDPPEWRLRVGDWRVIFGRFTGGIVVLRVLLRRDSYKR